MASKGEVVVAGPRPAVRPWGTALTSFSEPLGPEWEPDEYGVKRWLNGITFTPFGTDKSTGGAWDPCAERTTEYDNEMGDEVDFYPFFAEFSVWAPSRVADQAMLEAYVDAHLELGRSARLAEQLETGAHNPASPFMSSEAQVISNADQSLLGAVIAIEDALSDVLDGGVGMIHMPAGLLTALQAGGGLRYDEQGRASTATGHLIVADAGTLGVSPATNAVVAGETWIYGTGPVFAKYDDPVRVVSGRTWEMMRVKKNRLRADVEQVGIVYFDPETVVAALLDTSDDDIVNQSA